MRDLAAALVVATALCLPMVVDRPAFYLDWQNHLYLVAKQASYVAQHLAPTFFLNTVDRGWFYPFYAFYGGTLYYLVALVGIVLGSVWAAYVASYLAAVAAAFAGWTWLARQAGLQCWGAYLPGLTYVGGAYYLTNAYGRGAWPEFVATSAIPLALATSWKLLTSQRMTPSALVALIASVVVLTGSHAITLLLSLPFLVGALGLGLLIWRPRTAHPTGRGRRDRGTGRRRQWLVPPPVGRLSGHAQCAAHRGRRTGVRLRSGPEPSGRDLQRGPE